MRRNSSPTPSRPRSVRRRTAALLAGGIALPLLVAARSSDGNCEATAPHRVDLAAPVFSHPSIITNPLFPVGGLPQVVQLGHDAGESLRQEVTSLQDTKTIAWQGQQIEAQVSHFAAYLDGMIHEVVTDYYAQADDGSVWYFGEHVSFYENGVFVDHEGTWLAGQDGPPGMIMPANPQPGGVYRPEDMPPLASEEVTVLCSDLTVAGPRGPVSGAIRIQEVLMDGSTEIKVFAPGYGEFRARGGQELLTAAVAVPTDSLLGPVPAALQTLSTSAEDVFRVASSRSADRLRGTVADLTTAWQALRTDNPPVLLAQQMTVALRELRQAVATQRGRKVQLASLDVMQAALDLRLQYESPLTVDLARLEMWTRRLEIDRAMGNRAMVASDLVVLETIRYRVQHNGG